MFEIDRFIQAQDNCNSYETALEEIKNGYKRTHWIWYVFPQMSGLGESPMSKKYAISSLLEAKAYWDNPILKARLLEITEALYMFNGEPMQDILGRIDATKVRSCMTLFDYVERDSIFSKVLRDCFDGEYCKETRERMDKEYAWIRRNPLRENGLYADDRAFLDTGCYESDQYSKAQKIGTLIDLYLKGERIEQMVSHYFWSRDTSEYRQEGVVFALTSYIYGITMFTVDDQQVYEYFLSAGLKCENINEMKDALELARYLDFMMGEISKSEMMMGRLENFTKESLFRTARNN